MIVFFCDFAICRLSSKRRKAYCRLIVSLFEADVPGAIQALRDVGYKNSQSDRAPERDVEFFEFLFRSAGVCEFTQWLRFYSTSVLHSSLNEGVSNYDDNCS